MSSWRRALVFVFATSLLASTAHAAVPSPSTSTYPPFLVSCPFGDIPFEVVVRDAASIPIVGADVALNFLQCPNAFVCLEGEPHPYEYDPTTSYALASPDQDGDGFTANLLNYDAAIFQDKLGTTDPTADLDCDGDVDSDDGIIFNYHNSQSCLGYVDAARRSTWGRIKLHYR